MSDARCLGPQQTKPSNPERCTHIGKGCRMGTTSVTPTIGEMNSVFRAGTLGSTCEGHGVGYGSKWVWRRTELYYNCFANNTTCLAALLVQQMDTGLQYDSSTRALLPCCNTPFVQRTGWLSFSPRKTCLTWVSTSSAWWHVWNTNFGSQ